MKKNEQSDELKPEYDFAKMTGGVRGKYAQRFSEGTNLVRLDPDLCDVFPDSESVNRALHAIADIMRSR